MSKAVALRGALGGLYAHNAAESKKSREEARVSKMLRESDRQFHQQINKDPSQQLKILGRACKLSRDAAQYSFCENGASLMPWAGQEGCLIDRYDGRALLDLIPAPPTKSSVPANDDLLLESFLNYERYRDLVESQRRGHSWDDCWLIQRADDIAHSIAERQVEYLDALACSRLTRQVKKQREHQKVLNQIGREGRAVHEDNSSSSDCSWDSFDADLTGDAADTQGLCVGVLSYNQMRSFDKQSHQASDAMSDADKAARAARRHLRQQQHKKKPHIPQSKSSDAPIYNFAPPPSHLLRDAADIGDGRAPSSAVHELAAAAPDDPASVVTACHPSNCVAEEDIFHHVSMHALCTIPAADLMSRVARCRFISEFFPHLRGMYSSEESEQDTADRRYTTDPPAPALVAVKPKSAPALCSVAEARELTPAEKLKRRMMLALARTRQRDMQTSNLKAAAVEEEQRKTTAVREQMREVEADLRFEQRHKRRSNERRSRSRSSSPEVQGSSGYADRDGSRRRHEQVDEPFDAEAYLEATTFGFAGRSDRGSRHNRSRSRSRSRDGSYNRSRDRSWDRDRDRNRERQRAQDRGKDNHQDRYWRRDH